MGSLIFSLIVLAFSCKQHDSGTVDYSSLHFDTNQISIFPWDTNHVSPGNSDPLPLTQQDLIDIDSMLKDGIDSFNRITSPDLYHSFNGIISLDSFTIRYGKYKYQFIPYRDVNGQRIVIVIGFSANFQQWKNKIYTGPAHPGIRRLELKINLTEKSRNDIQFGGFG